MINALGYDVHKVRVTTLTTKNEKIILAKPFEGNMFIMPKVGDRIVVYGPQDERGNADMFLSSGVEKIIKHDKGVEFVTRNSTYLVESIT